MQSKNSVDGKSHFLSEIRFFPFFLLFILCLSQVRGEGKEIILINGYQVYSLSKNELTISESFLTDDNMIHFLVDEYPVFHHPKGIKDFVEGMLEYPEEALENFVEGVVLVNFVVEKDGTISTPRFIRSLGYGCEEEVLRVIDQFPAATPGKISGQPVRVGITLPIRFQLQYN